MLHSREQIIKNQSKFKTEISDWLKEDYKEMKKSLFEIKAPKGDEEIEKAKKNLVNKIKKVKINKDINCLFIHENNIYPKFYAWWDESNQQVLILKYNQ